MFDDLPAEHVFTLSTIFPLGFEHRAPHSSENPAHYDQNHIKYYVDMLNLHQKNIIRTTLNKNKTSPDKKKTDIFIPST